MKERICRRIFCLVHAEKLSYQVSDLALASLLEHSRASEEKGGISLGGECRG
jgi:hypothetical protein